MAAAIEGAAGLERRAMNSLSQSPDIVVEIRATSPAHQPYVVGSNLFYSDVSRFSLGKAVIKNFGSSGT